MKNHNSSIFSSKSRLIKTIIGTLFLLGIIFTLYKLNTIFTPNRVDLPWNASDKVKGFYELPENSLDLIFIGSSHAYCSFNPAVFAREAAIKSYNFTANEQPLWLSYYYIKEALKYQSPKAIVLEALYISEHKEYKRESINRINIDHIKPSLDKYRMIRDSEEEFSISKIVTLLQYHDRWKGLEYQDFGDYDYGYLKGYTPLFEEQKENYSPNQNVEPDTLLKKNRLWLDKIIALCKAEKVELILTYAPYQAEDFRIAHIKQLEKIAAENGVRFYNFLDQKLMNEIKLDFLKDLEWGHLNISGASKVSKFLARQLKETYTFDSNRNFDEYENIANLIEIKDSVPKIQYLNDYLSYLKDKNIFIFITAKDDASTNLTDQLKVLNSTIDWNDKFRWSYIGIFNPAMGIKHEIIDRDKIVYQKNKTLDQQFDLRMESAGFDTGNDAKIYVNGIDFLHQKERGLHFIIYDAHTNRIIESSYFDTFLNNNPRKSSKEG